jgi:ADP-ribose pyrophosphatase YjhB (NUDIX family)
MTEDEAFLAGYDPRAFPPVAVTADVVALTIRERALHLLLVRRAFPPYKGQWALPGGFIRPGEDLPSTATRSLAEKTSLARVHLEQLASFGDPGRDPRMRVVSVAYLAFAPGLDARAAVWTPVAALPKLAFDHGRIVADGLERARAKLEYTPLATSFVDPDFTIAELRGVYETVWGHPLHAANFHRKVLSVPGFVTATGEVTATGGTRGGRRAQLYRAGGARLLHPALLRPGTGTDAP